MRFTILPFLFAMIVALAGMPTNVYKVCAWNAGTLEVEPWRSRGAAALRTATQGIRAWLASLWSPSVGFACLAVLLALLSITLGAGHDGVLMALVPGLATMSKVDLEAKRKALVDEATALKGPGDAFKDDAARTAFDEKMTDVDAIEKQIRVLDAAPPASAVPPVTADAARQAEQTRGIEIRKIVKIARLGEDVADDYIKRNLTIDQARAEIFGKLEAAQGNGPDPNAQRAAIHLGEDARDKWVRGAMNWLLVRSGVAAMVAKHEGTTADKIDAGEFRGLSLLDLARESLVRAGQQVRGLDKMALAGLAMSFRANYQTTSDFSVLLENTMHKVLRAAYGITPDTWSRFCATGTVTDFRAHKWYRTGALSELDSLNEHGEFKNKAIPDGETVSYSVGTKGNIIGISRQTIVNDDMGAVVQMTQRLGRAGKLTIEKMVYALLAQNSGLGPTYGSAPLFDDTAHGNVSTGTAISAAAIDADRVKMAGQTDVNSNEYTDLRPSILLVPVGLGGVARIINQSQYDPDTLANKSQMKPNVVVGLFSDIVDTPRITGTRRYLFADPSNAPVLMVSFLEGQQEPVLETQDGWRMDGVEMKARLDVGVDAVDYRGAVTNAGTP